MNGKEDNYRSGKWLKEEEAILKDNAREFLESNGLTLPQLFKLPKRARKPFYRHCCANLNREPFSVYRKALRMFDEKNHIGTYSERESRNIMKLANTIEDEQKWKLIGEKMGRSSMSVRDHVTKVCKEPRKLKKWSEDEMERFKDAVKRYGNNWQAVSKSLGTRTARECLRYSIDNRRKLSMGDPLSTKDQVAMVEILSREPVNYADDIDWKRVSSLLPSYSSAPSPLPLSSPLTPENLRRTFNKLCLHRIPFFYQMNFNDMIEVLLENFVKPFREGKLKLPHGSDMDKRRKISKEKKQKKKNQNKEPQKEVIQLDEEDDIIVKTEPQLEDEDEDVIEDHESSDDDDNGDLASENEDPDEDSEEQEDS